jgi:uncharacterized membrane protein (GlpM family)
VVVILVTVLLVKLAALFRKYYITNKIPLNNKLNIMANYYRTISYIIKQRVGKKEIVQGIIDKQYNI